MSSLSVGEEQLHEGSANDTPEEKIKFTLFGRFCERETPQTVEQIRERRTFGKASLC